MIESFKLQNFRCFSALELTNLKRVNVITGANSSGKSALLEALLCAARGTPDALLVTNALRSVGIIGPHNFRALWDHLFYAAKGYGIQRTADKIEFNYIDTDQNKYSVEIKFAELGPIPQPQPQPSVIGRSAGLSTEAPTPLLISRSVTSADGDPENTSTNITLNSQGQIQGSSIVSNLGPAVFLFSSVMDYAEVDNVVWFSQLRQKGMHKELVRFIRDQFPFIADIEVLAPFGSSGLFASLKSGGVRRLQLISSGINKIITILLACANATNGVILVDEIENGIFYEKYEFMWSVLYKFAQRFSCQLFVTSHSLECLQNLAPVIGDNVDDFSLIRTERQNGKCIAYQISGAAMAAALSGKNEIRGATVGDTRNYS